MIITRKLIDKGLEVLHDLQKWAEEAGGMSSATYIAILHVGRKELALTLGPIEVWNSEDNEEEELSLSHCQLSYIRDVQNLAAPFTPDVDEPEDNLKLL